MESLSEMVSLLLILVLFFLFLVPFDRRIIEKYIMPLGDEPPGEASLRGEARDAKAVVEDEFSEKTIVGGPCTRQLCNMLELDVVLRDSTSSQIDSSLVTLAIGRWNDEAKGFEIVTEWCETWEELEEEARQAIKSFRGVTNRK